MAFVAALRKAPPERILVHFLGEDEARTFAEDFIGAMRDAGRTVQPEGSVYMAPIPYGVTYSTGPTAQRLAFRDAAEKFRAAELHYASATKPAPPPKQDPPAPARPRQLPPSF